MRKLVHVRVMSLLCTLHEQHDRGLPEVDSNLRNKDKRHRAECLCWLYDGDIRNTAIDAGSFVVSQQNNAYTLKSCMAHVSVVEGYGECEYRKMTLFECYTVFLRTSNVQMQLKRRPTCAVTRNIRIYTLESCLSVVHDGGVINFHISVHKTVRHIIARISASRL